MQKAKNYITPIGLNVLQTEHAELLQKERPALLESIAAAAANGDRSENADYIYGRRRLREVDRRIRFLSKRLENVEAIDPTKQSSDRVLFGATVTVLDEDTDEEKIYRIVGSDEIDLKKSKISWTSPVATALLQHRIGDSVIVKTPSGEQSLEILKIEYKQIP